MRIWRSMCHIYSAIRQPLSTFFVGKQEHSRSVVGSNVTPPPNGTCPPALPVAPGVTIQLTYHCPLGTSRLNVFVTVSSGQTAPCQQTLSFVLTSTRNKALTIYSPLIWFCKASVGLTLLSACTSYVASEATSTHLQQ